MHSTVDPRAIYSLFSVWQFGGKKNKKLQLCQQMSVSSSVHLSTIQKVRRWVYKFNISPVSQSTIQTVSLPVLNQATELINQTLFHQRINCSNSYSTVQKLTVCCESWFLTQFMILDSWANRESRIENWKQAIDNRVEDQVSLDRTQRLAHAWFLDNFTKR